MVLVALASLGLVARAGPLAVDAWIAGGLRPAMDGPVGGVVRFMNLLGTPAAWAAFLLAGAAALWRAGLRIGAALLLLSFSVEAPTTLVKWLTARPRPPGSLMVDLVPFASFPSGHVSRAVVAAGIVVAVVAWRSRRWRAPALLGALAFTLLMGASRVAAGDHWPTDVVGAYLLGALWLWLLLFVWTTRFRPPTP
jgi:undecaprenyl-diphosphatase